MRQVLSLQENAFSQFGETQGKFPQLVTPEKAGVQNYSRILDPGFRRNDEGGYSSIIGETINSIWFRLVQFRIHHFALIGLLAFGLVFEPSAQAEVYDDFNAVGIDPGKWKVSGTAGLFSQPGDGRLNFGPPILSMVTGTAKLVSSQSFGPRFFTVEFYDFNSTKVTFWYDVGAGWQSKGWKTAGQSRLWIGEWTPDWSSQPFLYLQGYDLYGHTRFSLDNVILLPAGFPLRVHFPLLHSAGFLVAEPGRLL